MLPQLVGGLELSFTTLSRRDDAKAIGHFTQMLANAEYWLSFDMAAFEPILAKCPSPLRELGVAVALRFGEGLDGELSLQDLERARELLDAKVSPDLRAGIAEGLKTLERAVRAREKIPALEAAGFKRHPMTQSLSVNALRAMGRSVITIAGHRDDERPVEVPIGEEIVLSAADERGRSLPPPEIESHLDAPVYVRDDKAANRRIIFLWVPGEYFVRVAGRAAGDRKLIAH